MIASMETLRKLINTECNYRMADQTLDRFLSLMTEIRLKNKEPLIPYGKFDNNIYIVKEGVIRLAYFNGTKEMTFGFAIPGTLMISYHSFYQGTPTFFQYESCCRSVIMKVSKANFDEFFEESKDFSNWIFQMSIYQLYGWEKKPEVMNGSVKERFDALVKDRPQLLKNVSNRVIASYLGIDEAYLSRLKKRGV